MVYIKLYNENENILVAAIKEYLKKKQLWDPFLDWKNTLNFSDSFIHSCIQFAMKVS